MVDRYIYRNIQKIPDTTLRSLVDSLARLVLENWLYLLFVIFLWRFPYIVADLTDSEVTPRRPTGDSAFWQSEMARALVLACLAMSYNLLFGFSGVISFGHALFFGAGGYVTFILMTQYDQSRQQVVLGGVLALALVLALFSKLDIRRLFILLVIGVLLVVILVPSGDSITFYQAAGLAIVTSIVLSLFTGVVTLRLRGIYFAMFTLALAEMFWVLAKSGTFRNISGAEDGLGFRDVLPESLNTTQTFDGSRLDMYRLTIIFFVIVFLAIRRYLNSPVGRVMIAVRENEERARTIGYNTFYYKILTMIFAGVIATLSGLLFVIWATDKRLHPETLSLKYTVDPLLNTLIGGVGTLTGPVVSTLSLSLGQTYLRNETFTLDTKFLGLITMWQVAALIVATLVLVTLRRPLDSVVARWLDGKPNRGMRQFGYYAGAFVLLAVLLLIVGGQIAAESDRVYDVADLWELFLGLLFVVVVMLLPHGIVGTWNRLWAERRIRQMEQSLQREKDGANP